MKDRRNILRKGNNFFIIAKCVFCRPPTYSEHVTRVAHTIDFSALGNDSEYSAVDVNNLQYEIHDDDNPSNDDQKQDGTLLVAKIDESAQRRICTKLQ